MTTYRLKYFRGGEASPKFFNLSISLIFFRVAFLLYCKFYFVTWYMAYLYVILKFYLSHLYKF